MKNIIAITQCFSCGSWICIEKILDNLATKDYKIIVLGLGEVQQRNEKFKYFTIPYPAFNRYGDLTCISPFLNLLWNLPLIICGFILSLIYRPQFITYNGLATGLVLSPLIKMIGLKNIVMYHSFVGEIKNKTLKRILQILAESVDMIIVNSRGSEKDVESFVGKNKIVINEHFVEEAFFDKTFKNKEKLKNDQRLNISYAGRIDEDKLCFPLMEVAEKLSKKGENGLMFNFAGAGSDVEKIEKLAKKCKNINYLGYINSRQQLKKFYKDADIVWSLGNETYLCLPGIEALATSTPIIVPIYSEIRGSDGNRTLIEKTLVPNKIGWFVDTNKTDCIMQLLLDIKHKGVSTGMQKEALIHSKKNYSKKNLDKTIKKILNLVGNIE